MSGSVIARPAVAAPAHASAASAAGSRAEQQAALAQLMARYAYGQSHGSPASALSALGKQIFAAAKVLGQHVTLPHAPANAAPVPQPVAATPHPGTVNLTA